MVLKCVEERERGIKYEYLKYIIVWVQLTYRIGIFIYSYLLSKKDLIDKNHHDSKVRLETRVL